MKVSTDSIYKNCIIKKKNLVNNSRKRTKHSAVSEEFDFGRMQVEGVNIVSLWLCGKRDCPATVVTASEAQICWLKVAEMKPESYKKQLEI